MIADVPSGTVTFLFTDIEDSTTIARDDPAGWEALRAHHHAILRSAIKAHHGYVFQIVGDAFCSAFHTVSDGVHAAVQAQHQLQEEAWGETPICVRMGLHTGEAQARDGDYLGYLTLACVQRVMSAAYGGQILLSDSSAVLLREVLDANLTLRDLGEQRLKSLPNAERTWQVLAPGLRQDFPPPKSLRTVPNNLPLELTSFVGREAEIADVRSLLHTHRLVTLTGPGGTGKTRLALRVAAQMLDAFKDGAWFVELASLSDPALVPSAVGSALGIRENPGRPLMTTLLKWLENRELLLVLDNCEHLIEACARFADAVLHASRGSHLLPTSREMLGIVGESAYQVPPLESPDPEQAIQMPLEEFRQYPAVRLFTERASDAVMTFSVTSTTAPAVAQICYRLDGIPLAIELAAARMKVLQVEQIAERLNDRFGLLTGGGRTALPRHQTLRSLIDWSHSLLSPSEQVLFRRLSAFAGGWRLEAAEQVCAGEGLASSNILDLLSHLVDKSLVGMDEAAQQPRYRMLETIHEYALEKLAESSEGDWVRNRHFEFMLALAENAEHKIYAPEGSIWLGRLDTESDNMRAALEWASNLDDAAGVLRLAGTLFWFWWPHGRVREADRWLRAALAKVGADKRTRSRAKALTAFGAFLNMVGQNIEACAALQESASISSEIGDSQERARTLTWLGWSMTFAGDFSEARAVLEESLALSREFHTKDGIGLSILVLGINSSSEGNIEEAEELYLEAASILREAGDKVFLAFAVRRLGYCALRQASFHRALDLCAESLTLNVEIGDQRAVAASLAAIACIEAERRHRLRAARLFGAAAATADALGVRVHPIDEIEHTPYLLATRAELSEEAYSKAFSEGWAMRMDEAIAYALDVEKEGRHVC